MKTDPVAITYFISQIIDWDHFIPPPQHLHVQTTSSMANNYAAWELNDAAQAAAGLSVASVVPVAQQIE